MTPKNFPFKTGILYQVKKDFQFPESDAFAKDELLYYVRSVYNHYDGIEICFFRDKLSTKSLKWCLRDEQLEDWEEYILAAL